MRSSDAGSAQCRSSNTTIRGWAAAARRNRVRTASNTRPGISSGTDAGSAIAVRDRRPGAMRTSSEQYPRATTRWPAESRSRNSASIAATIGAYGNGESTSAGHQPTIRSDPASAASRASSPTRRVFPTPASPLTITVSVPPAAPRSMAARSSATSAWRPTMTGLEILRAMAPIIPTVPSLSLVLEPAIARVNAPPATIASTTWQRHDGTGAACFFEPAAWSVPPRRGARGQRPNGSDPCGPWPAGGRSRRSAAHHCRLSHRSRSLVRRVRGRR